MISSLYYRWLTLRVCVLSSQALFLLFMEQHRSNIGMTGYANVRFHLSIMALRTKVDVVEDALVDADAVMVEAAEVDDMAAKVVVVVVDPADETTTTTSMVLTFLIPIAASVPMSGANWMWRTWLSAQWMQQNQPDVTELMTGVMQVQYCRVIAMTMRMTPAEMTMTIIILIMVVTMDAISRCRAYGNFWSWW